MQLKANTPELSVKGVSFTTFVWPLRASQLSVSPHPHIPFIFDHLDTHMRMVFWLIDASVLAKIHPILCSSAHALHLLIIKVLLRLWLEGERCFTWPTPTWGSKIHATVPGCVLGKHSDALLPSYENSFVEAEVLQAGCLIPLAYPLAVGQWALSC